MRCIDRSKASPSPPPMKSSTLVEAAVEIGLELCSSAVSVGERSTWMVSASNVRGSDPRERVPAGGSVYSGTAGIALFLAELYGATGNGAARKRAVHALRYALDWTDSLPSNAIGFYSGMTGVAFAAVRVGELTYESELVEAAIRLTKRIGEYAGDGSGLDVILGEAGAIPALLALAENSSFGHCRAIALLMGERVLASADRLPHGWAWCRMPNSTRALTGYAHGASGFGHALIELAAATSDDRYLYAAVRALQYERAYFDVAKKNWLDFRDSSLWEVTQPERRNEFRSRIQAGETFTREAPSAMNAWCHGAPGIGLVRLRVYELTGDTEVLEECANAVQTTAESFLDGAQGLSLCHGLGGNAETILYAQELFGDQIDVQAIGATFHRHVSRRKMTRTPWHNGTVDGRPDPTLLIGDAGIGHAFLRFAERGTPSVLLVRPRGSPAIDPSRALNLLGSPDYAEDMARFDLPAEPVDRLGIRSKAATGFLYGLETPLERFRSIRSSATSSNEGEEQHAMISRIAAARIHLLTDGMNWIADMVESEGSVTMNEGALDTMRWQLTQRALLVDSPIVRTNPDGSAVVATHSTAQLVVRSIASTGTISLSPLSHAIFAGLQDSKTLTELIDWLTDAQPGLSGDHRLAVTVLAQLKNAIAAGLVVPAWPVLPHRTTRTV